MGRDKGVNRTKGNVKPANSGRSAELLQSFGGKESLLQTTLLGGTSLVPILGSTTSSLQNDESQLDTNLTILLRKLGKKDSITKIKALGELNDICTNDPDVCTQILKYWPNYYVKLARDEDRKVRELSHVTLQIIGNNVGRNLATQIKSLFPVWFLSTNDTFAVVATKATSTFQNIFPTIDKQVQVCRFCCKEIFTFIRVEKMFQGTELSKVTAIEAIIKLIQMGVCDNNDEEETNTVIDEGQQQQQQQFEFDIDLESDGFWNLGKDESALVRRSFYTLLTLMAEKKLEQLNPKKNRLNQIMKSSLTDEKLELESLWNCFLTLIMKGFYPDKLYAKKQILICCKNGFYGNSNILGPLLLPLVDKVGPFTGEEIYVALGRGYDLEKGTNEGACILRTYAEILAYDFQSTKQVPNHTFPFLFQNLSASPEFGRVIGNLLKSADTFYEELKIFIIEFIQNPEGLDLIQSNSALGYFILSFIEPMKRKTKFREVGQSNNNSNRKENYDYNTLDNVKKLFVKDITKKLVEWKAWKSFSILLRNLASIDFVQNISIDVVNLEFTTESYIEGLKIILDVMKFQENPNSNSESISIIFYKLLNQFFQEDNVSIFLREIESGEHYDSLPSVAEYLQSETFISNQNSSVTKYMLKKGVPTFDSKVISERIIQLYDCSLENINLSLIQEIMNIKYGYGGIETNTSIMIDMNILYFKIWQLFLDIKCQQIKKEENDEDQTSSTSSQNQTSIQKQYEKLEILSYNILQNNRLSKSDLFDKIRESIPNCHNIIGLNNLVEISLKTIDNFIIQDYEGLFDYDHDLLIFLGFSKYPKLNNEKLDNPDFDSIKLKNMLKSIYFESKLIIKSQQQLEEDDDNDEKIKIETFIQLGLNLLFGISAYEVWKELEKFNWDWKNIDYCDELNIELTKVLELLQTSQNLMEFWNQVQFKGESDRLRSNVLWTSKYPEKYLMDTCLKMELIIPKPYDKIPNISIENENFINYLYHPQANIDGVIQILTKERNDYPDKFKFDILFSHLNPQEQQRLLIYLTLTIELLKKQPNFVSTASCWISSWLKYGKTIGNTKIYYLWVLKLNEAVILIDSISKTIHDSDFVQEYIEFHGRNIYPIVYSHFIQLNEELSLSSNETMNNINNNNNWKQFCSLIVCSSISLTPKPILLNIESNASIIFEVFTPILLKKSVPFKLAAYHILRRTKVKDEVIIPKELGQLLSRKVQDSNKHDKVLTLLLGWDTLLKSQLNTFELANFVKKEELLPKLLNLIFFKLIPETVNLKGLFETKPNLKPNILPSIGHLSCYILQEILRNLPYTVRWWWLLNLKQREKIIVEKIIIKYLSSKLATEELGKVQWNELQDNNSDTPSTNSDNVTVDSHPGCNELIAKYKIEETNVILKITLPLNHPLGPVIVQISDKKLLSKITQLLNTRSHSLSSGLKLWKESLDNIYKDVDECAICFFILHHVTKALPKLACSQCRKKFHAACLYKWFSTSNKSECPLCRNLF